MIILVFGCGRNHKPVISDLTCSPKTGSAGTVFTLTVAASDEDGDVLNYLWKTEEGSFTTSVNAKEIKWKSPVTGAGKSCTLTVIVSDGKNEVSREFQILLGEPEFGNLQGHVNYTNFKIPIPDVTVKVGDKTSVTDEKGYFYLAGIPAMVDTLVADKQDFKAFKSVIEIKANDTLNVPIEMTSVNFTTKAYGIITDQYRVPQEFAEVLILNPDGSESKLITTTNPAGYYRLWYIPFGERKIIVSKESTDDFAYSLLTKTFDFMEVEVQLNLVVQKTSFNGKFTDPRDQHVYNYKKMGYQTWMTENLGYLPEVSPPAILSTKEAKYYVYGYNGNDTSEAIATEQYKQYGVLYNWTALETACPPGWHAPSQTEWNSLESEVGWEDAGIKMKSVSGWNQHGGGSNSSGFNAFPAGQLKVDGVFFGAGDAAYLWTSTVLAYLQPGFRGLRFDSRELLLNKGSEKMGCSVRCVRNK